MAKVYFISGAAGSGKTFYAKLLAKKHGLKIIDFDDNINELIKANHKEYSELGSEKFLAKYANQRYSELIARAVIELTKGESIVIAAPFTKQLQDQKMWEELVKPLKDFESNPTHYWLNIPDHQRKARILARGESRDLEKILNIDQYMAQNPPHRPVIDHIVVAEPEGLQG